MKYYAFAYNATPNDDLAGYSPYELVYGRPPNTPTFFQYKPEPIYNVENYVQELRFKLSIAHQQALEFIQKGKESRKRKHDVKTNPLTVSPGDKVKMINEVRDKLGPVYKGPFVVKNVDHPITLSFWMTMERK